jgi:hypothetical protein
VSLLSDPNSVLCKNIPKEILEKDVSGRKYLEILSIIQPSLKPSISSVITTSSATTSSAENVFNKATLDMFGSENDTIIDLAQSICKDLNLNENTAATSSAEEMFKLLPTIQTYLSKKIEDGSVDMDKLQSQATNVLNKLKMSSEFQKVMSDNSALGSIMSMMPSSSSSSEADMFGNIMSMLPSSSD